MNHSTRRLQSISDAVLAIAATVLAVPLARIDETVRLDMYFRGKPLREVLKSDYQLESFAMFVGSFTLVYLVWVRHGRQFSRLTREQAAGETPALMVTNMLELFLATLLPYTTASASRARLTAAEDVEDRRNLALPFCANVFALATTRVVFESLAFRARPSLGTGFFNLCEATAEMIGSILVLALATSVLSGEAVFLPFLAVPLLSAGVRIVLTQLYGEPEHKKMDWHRVEGFVDGCVAVVSTLMVLEIKPPVDCGDMRVETCVLHFESGCRLKFDAGNLFKPPKCYFGRLEDQQRDVGLVFMYFVCFCLMFFLWYSHHEVVWFGYAPQRRSSSQTPDPLHLQASTRTEGSFRALFGSAWFCASLGLFPFAFSLVAEFAVKPYSEVHDPRLFPEFEKPLDDYAGTTACFFALGVLLSSSLPLAALLIFAPKRRLIPYSVYLRIFSYPLCVGLNALCLALAPSVKLWPLASIIPLVASSNLIGTWLETVLTKSPKLEVLEEYSTTNTPLIVRNPQLMVVPGVPSEFVVLNGGESEHSGLSSSRRTGASADAEYFNSGNFSLK
jgi:uncharacterized membrane protein